LGGGRAVRVSWVHQVGVKVSWRCRAHTYYDKNAWNAGERHK